jgi:hypothetical protein
VSCFTAGRRIDRNDSRDTCRPAARVAASVRRRAGIEDWRCCPAA